MAGDPLDPFGVGLPAPPAPVVPPIPAIAPIGQVQAIDDIAPIVPLGPAGARRSPVRTRSRPAIGKDYLLRPIDAPGDLAFRGPVRLAQQITPLIDGMEAFHSMEEAILDARSSVLMAFWLFDPRTRLVHDDSLSWLRMLYDAANRGVTVCLLTTDRDPGFDLAGHAQAWQWYFDMYQATGSLPAGKVQLVCSRHEAEVPKDTVRLIRPGLYGDIETFFNKISDAGDRKLVWQNAPGLWDKMDFDAGTARIKRRKPGEHYPVYPAVHHNKVAIIDGRVAFAGGMNIAPDYKDFPSHDMLDAQPWHDCFVKVEGREILGDFLRCYAGLWNKERVRCESFLTEAFKQRGAVPRISKTADLDAAKLLAPAANGVPPVIPSQIHRTVTKKSTAANGVPDVVLRDILDGYLKAIGKAEQFIYIENQYVREQAMINAIIARARAVPDLRVIFLMPKDVEELKNKSDVDAVNLHGAAVQFELLEKLKTALKKRLGLFTMLKKDGNDVYVHSKLIIVDDLYASIGSANTNPRGFRMDTELDFTWLDRKVTQQLRYDLWNEVLGRPGSLPSWKPRQFIEKWDAIARKNARRGSSKQGFVRPFENKERGQKFALADLTPFT